MIPKLFVLLYSKYSPNCQKLIGTIQENKIVIPGMHSVCIDNKKIRKRIMDEKTLNVTVVPCILSVFDNGTVEKYEGDSLYQFVGQFVPPKPERFEQHQMQQPPRFENKQEFQPENNLNNQETSSREIEPERKKINRNKNYTPATNVNNLKFEEDEPVIESEPNQSDQSNNLKNEMHPSSQFQKLDRNITKPNPKRIRNNDMSYDENESFFSDDQPETRKSSIQMKKDNGGTGLQDPHGTSQKASDLQREREMMDETINPKRGRGRASE